MTTPGQNHRTLFGIGYCRVSGDEQAEGTSLEDQEQEIRAYAEANGITLIAVLHESYTGVVYRERKVLSQMRERYRKGEANCVIVRTFDRLARNETHFAVLIDEMEHHKVELLCVKETLDNSIMGKLARAIIAGFAEFEHQKILDRTLTGKRNLILIKKQFMPGPKPLYGYDWVMQPRAKATRSGKTEEIIALTPNEQESKIVLRVHVWFDEGLSIRQIVRQLTEEGVPPSRNNWNRKAIQRMLSDRRYIGQGMAFATHRKNARYPLESVPLPEGTIPAILPVDLFERNQKRIAWNNKESSRRNMQAEEFLLRAGYIRCAICKTVMTASHYVHKENGRHEYAYVCTARYDFPPKDCPGQRVNAKRLDERVWRVIEKLANDISTINKAVANAMQRVDFGSEVRALEESMTKVQAQVAQYQEDLKNPSLRGGARNLVLADLSHEQEKLEKLEYEKQLLQTGQIDVQRVNAQIATIMQWCQKVKEQRADLSYDGKRMLLRMLGVQVWLKGTEKRGRDIDYTITFNVPEIAEILRGSTASLFTEGHTG